MEFANEVIWIVDVFDYLSGINDVECVITISEVCIEVCLMNIQSAQPSCTHGL